MDPLSHALVGAVVGYAVRGRALGRHAAGLGALAASTPDVDHFIRSESDPLLYVEYHRYFTHSLAFAVVGAFVPLLPWIASQKFRARWRDLWLCSFPAYLSHCLLDASTTWGTQLLWPFTRTRVSWDIIAIVDPVFTLMLAALLGFALVRHSRSATLLAVLFVCTYLALGAVQHHRGMNVQRQLAKSRGHRIERSEVMPTLANNIVWRSVYLANGRIFSDRIRVGWFSTGTVREGTSLPLLTRDALTGEERAGNQQHRSFERFAWFSDGWVARAPNDPTVIGDMRYSRSTEAFDPVWGIRFTNSLSRATVEWVSRERERSLHLRQLWDEITGDDPSYRDVQTGKDE